MRQSQSHLHVHTDWKYWQQNNTDEAKEASQAPIWCWVPVCKWTTPWFKKKKSKWAKTPEVNAIALLFKWLQMTPPPVSLIFYPDFCRVGGRCDVTSIFSLCQATFLFKKQTPFFFCSKVWPEQRLLTHMSRPDLKKNKKKNGSKWLMWHCRWVTLYLSRHPPHNSAVFKICLIHQPTDSSETMSE